MPVGLEGRELDASRRLPGKQTWCGQGHPSADAQAGRLLRTFSTVQLGGCTAELETSLSERCKKVEDLQLREGAAGCSCLCSLVMMGCVTDGLRWRRGRWWNLWAYERMEKGEEGAWLRFVCAVVVPRGKVGCSCVLGLWQ